MGDLVNAMKDYQLAIKSDTTYSLAYFNAANVYFHTRRFEQVSMGMCISLVVFHFVKTIALDH